MKTILRQGGGISLLSVSLVLVGCSMAPDYGRPAPPMAAQWKQPAVSTHSAAATLDWPRFVTDASLRSLVELALSNNRDLRQSLLNVEAARALYRIQRADQLPGVGLQGSAARQRLPADLSGSGRVEVQGHYQVGLGVTAFELDLFGRVRNLSQAALEDYLATEEAAHAARISLVAEVIAAYLTRQGAEQRLLLTSETLATREVSLRLAAERRRAGTATALDYQEALGLTEQSRAEQARIDREFRQADNALTLLIGVSDLSPHLPQRSDQRLLLVQELAAGTPSDLLIHRPDILAAEHRLRARYADIGAARAAFFPQISLTGLFGTASADLSDLFRSGQRTWSFAPQLTLPIFNAGRNRANLDLATVRRDIAVAAYEQAIQTAFREVSDARAATDTLRCEEAARQTLAAASSEALRLAEARWRAGVDSHLRYLDAQRSDFANQALLIEIRTQRQIALATLFKTLGGGWLAAGKAGAE